jgi:hypothetical protein
LKPEAENVEVSPDLRGLCTAPAKSNFEADEKRVDGGGCLNPPDSSKPKPSTKEEPKPPPLANEEES